MTTTTTTTIYYLLLTQFWPNIKVRFLWPTIIATTTPPTTTRQQQKQQQQRQPQQQQPAFLGCDSIEINLVSTILYIAIAN